MKNTLQADEIVYEMPCVRMKNSRIKKPQWPESRVVEVHYEAWQAGPYLKPAASLCRKNRSAQTWEIRLRSLPWHCLSSSTGQSAQIQQSPQMTSKCRAEARGWLPPSTAFHLVFLRQGLLLDPELTKCLSWLTSKLQDLLVCLPTSAYGFRGFEWRSSCLPSIHFTN